MFTKIEIENFQSHKNTIIEFDKGINSICGESDNGKSAVIRAIRWLVENRPLGTDKLNSNWNKDFKKPMRVRLYTENGWVERIRSKDRNGYTICHNNSNPIELSAVGTDVPEDVSEFLKVSDVNFQFQLDQPYLITKTPGDASKYLNNIIHLDSIDKMLSVAESDKRNLSSQQKLIESDIKELTTKIEQTEWLEEAKAIKLRIDKYDKILSEKSSNLNELKQNINEYKSIKVIDLSEQKDLIKQIKEIQIPDDSELKNEISLYKSAKDKVIDLSEQKKLIDEIENIVVPDSSELQGEIDDYKSISARSLILKAEIEELKSKLPNTCPLCGGRLEEGVQLCS